MVLGLASAVAGKLVTLALKKLCLTVVISLQKYMMVTWGIGHTYFV